MIIENEVRPIAAMVAPSGWVIGQASPTDWMPEATNCDESASPASTVQATARAWTRRGAVVPAWRSSDRLASVGLGARYAKGAFSASLDYGRLVLGSRVPLAFNPNSPKKGDDRVYVNVGLRF